jgi:hypothetical protein
VENRERLRIGLCFDCCHHRLVPGGRSTFYLCRKSFTDPAFPKYPHLPVVACGGYQPQPPPAPAGGDAGDKLAG